jgi:taurine dioxygenase
MTSRLATAPQAQIAIHKVAGRIGAEISGVRLSGELSPDLAAAIDHALVEHKVIFFRGQTHLDDAQQEAFAALLGTPLRHPTQTPVAGAEYTLELNSERGERANVWHTDITFVAAYPKASILRAVVIPPWGGDTMWANTAAACADLPPQLRALAESLRAIHTNIRPVIQESGIDPERVARFQAHRLEAEHPVVRVHPDSGEPCLVLGDFADRFVGLDRADSARIWKLLQAHITRPENTVRWRWQPGDVAIWDNRATQHYALADFGDQRRIMRRVTIAGDVPVGLDGRPSVTRDVSA